MRSEADAVAKLEPDLVVDHRTYVSARVYQREMERLFDRSWMLVAHASGTAQARQAAGR